MPPDTLEKSLAEAESAGIKQTGMIGGQPKQRYYLPTGEIVFAMPDMHNFHQIENGKIVAEGIRDANLDRGWLTSKPEKLQIACGGCKRWHKSQKEVDACIKKTIEVNSKWETKARREVKKDSPNVEKLESEVKELKTMFGELLKELKSRRSK